MPIGFLITGQHGHQERNIHPGFQERFQSIYKLIGPFEKIIWKKADALVANSQGLKKLASDFYDKKEIQIITNGVDEKWLQSGTGQVERHDDEIRLLFVFRLIERKGLQFILPQLGRVNEQARKRVTLMIVGDGPYRPEIERIVAEHHLTDLVTFAGQKNKSELPPYYQAADIFVLPSKKEGMPNVVLEAMASGLPIVMTPCEGSEELIRGNGYAVPASEFGDRLISLCRDEELRRQMGSASLQLVREQFRWSSIAAEYLELMNNRQRSVFPSDTALLKALYLSTFEATKKWTTTIRNWAQVYGELSIMYEGRLPE